MAFSFKVFAQTGVNTTAPTATLEVNAKNATGSTTNVDGLLIPRVDRQRAQSMTAIPTSTLIYINSITTGTATGITTNVDAIGYYYYDGTFWTKLSFNANIYNTDGTLGANRTVTQGANKLAFTANALNAFSVNGTNFSIDASNKRVGIGTAAPSNVLHVVATGTNDPIRIENLQTGALQGKEISVDNTGVLKMLPGKLIVSGAINTFTTLGASNVEVQLPLANVLQNTTGGTLTGNVFTVPVTGVYEVDFSADILFTSDMAAGASGLVGYYMYDVTTNARLGDKSNGTICAYSQIGLTSGGSPVGTYRLSCGTKFFVNLTANQRIEFRAKPLGATANIVQARVSFLSIQQIN
jgi:hypothetical protein